MYMFFGVYFEILNYSCRASLCKLTFAKCVISVILQPDGLQMVIDGHNVWNSESR